MTDNAPSSPVTTAEPQQSAAASGETHSILIGYILWIFGFMGAHRFYYGKPKTGTLWFFTLGLLFVGWFIDLFLVPAMDREAERRFVHGDRDYNISWLLLAFTGVFGFHRMYLGKWLTGGLFLIGTGLTATGLVFFGPLVLLGVLYDYWTLNRQVSDFNSAGG